MVSRSDELERFKQEIDLRQLAAEFGFFIDQKASSPSGTVMRHSDGAKLRITRGHDRHFVYWNAHDERDSGSVIDFLQRRTGANLGEVRKKLRPWIGGSAMHSPPPPATKLPELVPIKRDIAAVQAQIDGMAQLEDGVHAYLNDERGIPPEILADPRFADRIRVDARSNAVFLHFNQDGACGFELKNRGGFTGFAKSGAKGLWPSLCAADDERLVFTEGSIDALSYAVLHGFERTRFVSLAGKPSPEQMILAASAIKKHPAGEIVLAFDNDEAGDRLIDTFTAMFEDSGRGDLALREHRPETRGADWNAALTAEIPPRPTRDLG